MRRWAKLAARCGLADSIREAVEELVGAEVERPYRAVVPAAWADDAFAPEAVGVDALVWTTYGEVGMLEGVGGAIHIHRPLTQVPRACGHFEYQVPPMRGRLEDWLDRQWVRPCSACHEKRARKLGRVRP